MRKSITTLAVTAFIAFFSSVAKTSAELPMLDKPWLGYFAVAEEGAFRFVVTPTGEFKFVILNKEKEEVGPAIPLVFFASEILPDGSVRDLPAQLDTLQSADLPTEKLKKATFTYKVGDQPEGQPTIEIVIESKGGTILASTRITDQGSFTNHPLKTVIRASFTPFYEYDFGLFDSWDKSQIKSFEKLISKDVVNLKRLDGGRTKLSCIDETEPNSSKINGTGISSAEVKIIVYQKRAIEILAGPGTAMTFFHSPPAPLIKGFWFQGAAVGTTDPESSANLAFRIK